MPLPENLRRLRITDGQSAAEVAEATGLPLALIQAIENGRARQPPRVLKALAAHFRIAERELTR